MSIEQKNAPHIRYKESNRTMMTDMIIALIPLLIMGYYYYGIRSLIVGAISVGSCVISDIICCLLYGKKINFRDFSSIVTGLILAMMFPASIGYHIVIYASIFAIFVVKFPFGGVGNNIFNPAAAAFAFVSICWNKDVFKYPLPMEKLPLDAIIDVKLFESVTHNLRLGSSSGIDIRELLLGNYTGPMGATNILVIITCFVFLLSRKTISWSTPIMYTVGIVIFAYCFPRITNYDSHIMSVLYELLSGTVIFGAVYMVSDPVTSPKTDLAKGIYGFLCGILTMLFRHFGAFEQGLVFSILFMNVFSHTLDRLILTARRKTRHVFNDIDMKIY